VTASVTRTADSQNALVPLGAKTVSATANAQKALGPLAVAVYSRTADSQKALGPLAHGSLRSPLACNVASLRSATLRGR